ncbi:High-affinity zinc uptake system binding-protein ZnuA precursor [compost metagenome]
MRESRGIIFNLLGIILIVMLFVTGCGKKEETNPNSEQNQVEKTKDEKVLVYTSLFPIYDFTRKIGGEHVTVKSIVPTGAEPHDFEPSPKDMAELNRAKLFIYNGAGYETWIEKVTQNLDQAKTKPVDASQGVQLLDAAKEEEPSSHDEHDTEKGSAEKHEDDHGVYDPHIWLDPMRAKQQAENIRKALVEVDPTHKDEYQANYDKLATELASLDKEYKDAIGKAQKKEFVTSHRSFAYLAEHYGLEQIAVSGLSPSEEPSQRDLSNLIDTVKKHNIKYVGFEELVQSKVAQAVQRETGAEAIILNPIENVTKEQFAAGKTYIDLMKENLETLKKMLEEK